MKRIILSICALCIAHCIFSQGLMDVSRMANTDIMGTARYMSMAGSMGALGGDPSAVLDNPAALGIYRSSELSFTLNATPSVTLATSSTHAVKQNDFFFNFNQLSYVISLQSGKDHGYVSSNFSFAYNRLKDFHRQTSVAANGTTSMTNMIADLTNGFHPSALHEGNIYVPYMSVLGYEGYLMDPYFDGFNENGDSVFNYTPYDYNTNRMAYRGEESGRIDEYNFSYAANIGHYLYIGAGVGMQTLNYHLISSSGEMYEGAMMTLKNEFRTSGIGWNVRVGAIVRPVSWMRLGFSFQSPTWYSLTDRFYAKIVGEGTSADYATVEYSTPSSSSSYGFNSPLKLQASAGFVLGKVALINVDYLYSNNVGMRLKGSTSSDYLFAEPEFVYENEEIKNYSLSTHTIKVGAEFRIASQFSFRAGAAYRTPNLTDNATRTLLDNTTRTDMEVFVDKGMFYASGGFGYRYNGFGIDLTYAYSEQNQAFSPVQQGAELLGNGYYGVKEPQRQTHLANIKTMRHNAVLTILYKF